MLRFGATLVSTLGSQRSTKGSAMTGAESCMPGSDSALVSAVGGERSTEVTGASATTVPALFHSPPISSARAAMPIRTIGTKLYLAIRSLSKLPAPSPGRLIPKSPDSSFHTQEEQEKNAPNQGLVCLPWHIASVKANISRLNEKLEPTKPFLAGAATACPRIQF